MPWWVLSSFFACLSLWLVNEKVRITEEVSIICTAMTYYVMLMVKYTCAWLHHPLKLLPSTLLSCTDSSQPGWFHVETHMHVLGLWYAIQLVLSSEYNDYDRLEDRFIMYQFTSLAMLIVHPCIWLHSAQDYPWPERSATEKSMWFWNLAILGLIPRSLNWFLCVLFTKYELVHRMIHNIQKILNIQE